MNSPCWRGFTETALLLATRSLGLGRTLGCPHLTLGCPHLLFSSLIMPSLAWLEQNFASCCHGNRGHAMWRIDCVEVPTKATTKPPKLSARSSL